MATKEAYVQDEELISLLSMLTLDDFIAGVIAQSNVEVFSSCTASLHGFFSELKDSGKMPEPVDQVLGQAVFEAGDWFPFSREVENALFRLQVGGLLSADNPEYSRLRMKQSAKKKAINRLSSQDVKTKAFIDAAGKKFAMSVGASPIAG